MSLSYEVMSVNDGWICQATAVVSIILEQLNSKRNVKTNLGREKAGQLKEGECWQPDTLEEKERLPDLDTGAHTDVNKLLLGIIRKPVYNQMYKYMCFC